MYIRSITILVNLNDFSSFKTNWKDSTNGALIVNELRRKLKLKTVFRTNTGKPPSPAEE